MTGCARDDSLREWDDWDDWTKSEDVGGRSADYPGETRARRFHGAGADYLDVEQERVRRLEKWEEWPRSYCEASKW